MGTKTRQSLILFGLLVAASSCAPTVTSIEIPVAQEVAPSVSTQESSAPGIPLESSAAPMRSPAEVQPAAAQSKTELPRSN